MLFGKTPFCLWQSSFIAYIYELALKLNIEQRRMYDYAENLNTKDESIEAGIKTTIML